MDRLRRVWNDTHRPPPLRTTSTYDDDEAFQSTAKQILARVKSTQSSPRDAIYHVLVSANQRACFWEGLNQRKDRDQTNHLPSGLAMLVQALEDASVGKLLKDICSRESSNPKTPRCDNNTSSSSSHHTNNSAEGHQQPYSAQHQQPKKCSTRRFFPADFVVMDFRKNTRRVQNIDWKLCEANSAVDSFRLDGPSPQARPSTTTMTNDPMMLSADHQNTTACTTSCCYVPPHRH
jgi:hypothetical protein